MPQRNLAVELLQKLLPEDWKEWELVTQEEHPADERHAWLLSFRLYQRIEG